VGTKALGRKKQELLGKGAVGTKRGAAGELAYVGGGMYGTENSE
jgi:hypothetical protein